MFGSRAANRAAVPTGTVDLPTTRQSRSRFGASPVDHGFDVAEVGAERAGQLRRPDADEVNFGEAARPRQATC